MSKWKPGPGAKWKRDERTLPPDVPDDQPIVYRVNGRKYLISRQEPRPWWRQVLARIVNRGR